MKKLYKIKIYDSVRGYMARKPKFDRAVLKAMKSGDYVLGSETSKFEANLAQYLGVKHVIGVGNGTDALQIALMSLNLPKGSQVILPAFDYISSTEMIKLLGFEPVYADITNQAFSVCPQKIYEKLNPKVKVIIVSHLFGQVVGENMDRIMDFAKRNNIFVIEDFAQAIGCKAPLRGDIGTTSFYTSKNLGAFGDGGGIFTNNKNIALYARMLANHGNPVGEKYNHIYSGVNSRLDNIQASILNVKLKYLDIDNKQRQKIASKYSLGLLGMSKYFSTPMEFGFHSYHQYMLLLNSPLDRNKIRIFLAEKGIATEVYYPYYFGENNVMAEYCSKRMLALPMNPFIKDSEVKNIIQNIKEYFAKK